MKADHDDCVIIPHSNAIKPTLDEHHKFARVLYSVANLNLGTEECTMATMIRFTKMRNGFLSEAQLLMYLVPGEAPPKRSTRHKSHILKVMFLATLARPRYNRAGDCNFDGTIGIWTFVESVAA
jgi:hypothetical protein